MATESKILNKILVISTVLLCYPLLEFFTPLNISGKVQRTELRAQSVPFSANTWFDQSFQESFMNYMNDHIGLFHFFVQTHNQTEYSLFGNIHTGNVVEGKDHYLFERDYLNAYFGKNFIGLRKIEDLGTQLKQLQDTLATMDKFLFYCLAAGKATYYPEYLPYQEERDSTNNEFIVREFDSRGIKYINCKPWFLDMKDSLGYLLYPPIRHTLESLCQCVGSR